MAKINTTLEKTKYFYLINNLPSNLSINNLPGPSSSVAFW
jgi:hypothetical protein